MIYNAACIRAITACEIINVLAGSHYTSSLSLRLNNKRGFYYADQ
jgi:hypothetical protein